MTRSITLSKSDVAYMEKCADFGLTYGIIICHTVNPGNFHVVHLAKNSEEDVEILQKTSEVDRCSIKDISIQALATQWISACKMCPGSFSVRGVFITSEKNNVDDDQTYADARKMLYDMHNLFIKGNNFCVSIDEENLPILFLAYSTLSRKAVCKVYTHNTSGGFFESITCHYMDKSLDWHAFECCYDLDDVFPIFDNTEKINIENQFQRSLNTIKKSLTRCEMFIENAYVEDSMSVETFVSGNEKKKPYESYKTIVLLPVKSQNSSDQSVKVRKFNGTIRFLGVISSRIWCNNKNTLGDVKRFIRNDILRSLAARIQVYCDGLTDPHVSSDAIFISEPPRRVFFNIFVDLAMNPIQFSEYIFRGESPTVAVAQAKQVLDLDISTKNIFADMEGLPYDEIFNDESVSSLPEGSHIAVKSTKYFTRSMYMLSIAISLLVLLLSVWLHYFLR